MDPFNPTQILGLAGFASAAVLCAKACHSARTARSAWGVLAGVHIMLAMEVLFGGRFVISDTLRAVLKSMGSYPDRATFQEYVLPAFVLVVGGLGTWVMMRHLKTAGPIIRLAGCATLATGLLFGVETLSLHQVDALLYRTAGPVLLIGWLWLALGGLTAGAAAAALAAPKS